MRFGAIDVTKPYEFIRFGAIDVTKLYDFIRFPPLRGFGPSAVERSCWTRARSRWWRMTSRSPSTVNLLAWWSSRSLWFGAMDVTKPYDFIRFGAIYVTKPYDFIGFPSLRGFGPSAVEGSCWTSSSLAWWVGRQLCAVCSHLGFASQTLSIQGSMEVCRAPGLFFRWCCRPACNHSTSL